MKYVPLDDLKMNPAISGLKSSLREKIIGQDHAIEQIVQTYQTYLAGMCQPRHPVGSFLFLGPTGTGKTRIVEAVAEVLVGKTEAVIKIDCGEFQHSHEIAKLLGSPPGYLGHRETQPLLCQERLNQYHTGKIGLSFVLFDEIEKASNALWNLLLGILDKAILTLGDNRQVNFACTMVFMTGNLGSGDMENILAPRMGFQPVSLNLPRTLSGDKKLGEQLSKAGMTAARKKFTPEFLNRIDKIVVFNPLEEKELRRILNIELDMVRRQIAQSPAMEGFVGFALSSEAEDFLLKRGTDPKCGARHLRRTIQKFLVMPLATFMTTCQIEGGDYLIVNVDPEREKLFFVKEVEDRPKEAGQKQKNVLPPVLEHEKVVGATAGGGVHD